MIEMHYSINFYFIILLIGCLSSKICVMPSSIVQQDISHILLILNRQLLTPFCRDIFIDRYHPRSIKMGHGPLLERAVLFPTPQTRCESLLFVIALCLFPFGTEHPVIMTLCSTLDLEDRDSVLSHDILSV